MSFFDQMENDLAHSEEMLAQQVTIGGHSFPCVFTDFRSGETSDFEYNAGTAEVEVRVRKGAVGSWVPTKGAKLTVNNEGVQIESWIETSAGLQWVLFCRADRRR